MARKRENKRALPLKDHHLWTEVTRTIRPLRHKRAEQGSVHAPKQASEPLPSGQGVPVTLGASARNSSAPSKAQKRMRTTGSGHEAVGQAQNRLSSRPGEATLRAAQPIEPRLKRRLQRGHLPIDATLDLHGMRQAEAHTALKRFIVARHARGDRTVLVITGKGLKSTRDGQIAQRGVLREMLPRWLVHETLAPLVSGWELSAQVHGGEGAFYVRLKRQRS